MRHCSCRVLVGTEANLLRLRCVACQDGIVRCSACGGERWWAEEERVQALNAAEAHRWETGHPDVVVRDSTGVILREVLGGLAAA